MTRSNFCILFIFIAGLFSCRRNNENVDQKSDNIFYDQGLEFSDKNETDSAFRYFNMAKDLYLQSKDSLGVGRSLTEMAIIETDKGDHFGSQETLLEALSYLNDRKKTNRPTLSATYHTLGVTASELQNYDEAIKFYEQSLNYTGDSSIILITKNNIANAYRKKGNFTKALSMYRAILNQKIDRKEFSRTLSNFAFTKWLEQPDFLSSSLLLKALHIRQANRDLWGQNASFAHLSDYYQSKNRDSSLFFANKMYEVAKILKSPDDQVEALAKLTKLSSPKNATKYFERYVNLSDSIQKARNAAKNQFALIRYESEKSKAQNLILQKDNAAKTYQIIILAFAALAALVIGIIWYRKRKQRLEQEAQDAIRENQLNTSKKVHDVVANGLYRVMIEIENEDEVDKEGILDRIENLYEQSRDISYEKPRTSKLSFYESLDQLLRTFASDDTRILLVGNNAALWQNVPEKTKTELEHILQELMVNMKKHSYASDVVLKFERNDQQIKISYTDNGVGFDDAQTFNNGLTNTGNRINTISGNITFDTKAEKGLKIKITFPVS